MYVADAFMHSLVGMVLCAPSAEPLHTAAYVPPRIICQSPLNVTLLLYSVVPQSTHFIARVVRPMDLRCFPAAQPELLDDLLDHWSAKTHEAEKRSLVSMLQDLALVGQAAHACVCVCMGGYHMAFEYGKITCVCASCTGCESCSVQQRQLLPLFSLYCRRVASASRSCQVTCTWLQWGVSIHTQRSI